MAESGGIEGLRTAPGRGRKQILNRQTDEQKVRQAVQQERQRLTQAKAALEAELDKQFSTKTLKRFLKKLSADGSESD
jgi:transposase